MHIGCKAARQDLLHRSSQDKPNRDMKTTHQIEITPKVASRRSLNMRTAVASVATQQRTARATEKNAIRLFQVNVPEAELTELRRRISATKWPERETVTDSSQGVQLATMQRLA